MTLESRNKRIQPIIIYITEEGAMKLKLNPAQIAGSVFPILRWAKGYNIETGVGDLIAGVTVALTLVPQSIAYASLAGFDPQVIFFFKFSSLQIFDIEI